jgi:hypothetical protein
MIGMVGRRRPELEKQKEFSQGLAWRLWHLVDKG